MMQVTKQSLCYDYPPCLFIAEKISLISSASSLHYINLLIVAGKSCSHSIPFPKDMLTRLRFVFSI